jgi:mono/diheme cytochrome c family protein
MSKMNKAIKLAGLVVLAAFTLAPAVAQTAAQTAGADIYKTKCQNCHGQTGLANSGAGSIMKVKPITDPAIRKQTEAEMIAAVKNGMGKMQSYKSSLSDAQIKGAVDYYRTFIK